VVAKSNLVYAERGDLAMNFNIVVPIDGPIVLIVMTQLVLTLYGAGLRRPFGSVETVQFLPRWLRRSGTLVLVADVLFAVFVVAMWIVIFEFANRWWAIGIGLAMLYIGDILAHRINLVWSFFISLLLMVGCIVQAILIAASST
jgi:hypothetical protein